MLATNFGSLCQTVTKVGSQNSGYQIWFCTRLLEVELTTNSPYLIFIMPHPSRGINLSVFKHDFQLRLDWNDKAMHRQHKHNIWHNIPLLARVKCVTIPVYLDLNLLHTVCVQIPFEAVRCLPCVWALPHSTHLPLVTHIYISELGQHWFR